MLPRQFGDYMLLYVANIPSVLRGLNLSNTKKIGLDLSLAVFFINIVGMRILFHSFFLSPASPDCDFDEGMCDWGAQEAWILDKRLVNRFEKRGKMMFLCDVSPKYHSM